MVISKSTQMEMYTYLLDNLNEYNVKVFVNFKDDNSQEIIVSRIRNLARRLFNRSELFIKKSIIEWEDDVPKPKAQYSCKSNQLIYWVLHNIGGCENIIARYRSHISADGIDFDLDNIPKSGERARQQLIYLCKLFIQQKDIEPGSQKNHEDTDLSDKEYRLAEAVLHTYSKKWLGDKAVDKKEVLGRREHAQALKTDIIINVSGVAIIEDVKVYKSFSEVSYGQLVYTKNNNRYQVNSYIGAYLDKNSNISNISGLLIHVVSPELFEKNRALQGADLTIESDRPMRLFLIEDKGLESILTDYEEIIKDTLLN